MTIAGWLRSAAAQGLSRLDAQMLLLHTLGRPSADRAWLLAHDTDPISPTHALAFEKLLARRQSGEPVAYLVGHKEFFGLNLQVDARVLVPRPDTEVLVEWALDTLAKPAPAHNDAGTASDVLDRGTGSAVLDLGTGSGAVALAIKFMRPDLPVHACDLDPGALAVAQANAARLGLAVQLHHARWFDVIKPTQADGASASLPPAFQLIVSNPPYIAAADPHLAALACEPLLALTSGADGLDDLRLITSQARQHLRPGGWLLLEHGHDQSAAVQRLLWQAGFLAVQSRADLSGILRCSGGQNPADAGIKDHQHPLA